MRLILPLETTTTVYCSGLIMHFLTDTIRIDIRPNDSTESDILLFGELYTVIRWYSKDGFSVNKAILIKCNSK